MAVSTGMQENGFERQMAHENEKNESEKQVFNSGYKPGGLVCFYCGEAGH